MPAVRARAAVTSAAASSRGLPRPCQDDPPTDALYRLRDCEELTLRLAHGRGPPALDVAEVPYAEGDHPRGDEQADDHEAERVEVELRDEFPHAAVKAELRGEHRGELDGADDQRDCDGQRGDGHV